MISINRLYKALAPDVATLLADDDRNGSIDEETVEDMVASAELDIRGSLYIAGYDVEQPLTPYLEDLAITLAVERLLERRPEIDIGSWKDRADRVRRILMEIEENRHPVDGMERRSSAIPSADPAEEPVFRSSSLKPY